MVIWPLLRPLLTMPLENYSNTRRQRCLWHTKHQRIYVKALNLRQSIQRIFLLLSEHLIVSPVSSMMSLFWLFSPASSVCCFLSDILLNGLCLFCFFTNSILSFNMLIR